MNEERNPDFLGRKQKAEVSSHLFSVYLSYSFAGLLAIFGFFSLVQKSGGLITPRIKAFQRFGETPSNFQFKPFQNISFEDVFGKSLHQAPTVNESIDMPTRNQTIPKTVNSLLLEGYEEQTGGFDSYERFSEFLKSHAFIHIPKTGGKTLEWLASKAEVPIGLVYGQKYQIRGYVNSYFRIKGKYHRKSCSWAHVPPIWLHRNESESSRMYFENRKTFCFYRSPYDRAVSEFKYHRKSYAKGLACSKSTLNSFLQSKLGSYSSQFNPDEKNNSKTAIFMQDDCHYIPQYYYLQSCDIQIETKAVDNWLKQNFNLDLSKHMNNGKCRLTANDLDENTKLLIANVYQNDIQYLEEKHRSE
mmetsp:Transcript_4333/g.5343  ORF Transcript_4333/g.5343 Transcript_4333/m.5343 type:complete len:359 (+) Transcript_4333:84-1160(+)|eukprot:CAMPEP_0184030280 /NCGR_PEP_ID=MMETSP0955-20130417/1320_1 /TAXON_ID=627963 /ORGANISM="Aplanochytrium sp, Strain PBS07" /LENGTH=358 /DNA_ID=CAMNT_0026315609 /DNA_START=78 /DNA_END=1154 /DNA_ORIENTATION=-